jgi:ornithine carbamoyltransferase
LHYVKKKENRYYEWMPRGSMKRDLVSVLDMQDDLPDLIDLAIKLKKERGKHDSPLHGKTLGMIFEKQSTRTRVSFDVAISELGGHPTVLSTMDMQMGRGETVGDTAKVLSRFLHCIMYRAYSHKMVMELAENSTIPVINGLDDTEHPCQALADMVTIKEKKGGFKGLKLVYLGDGNNVTNSLMLASAILGMDMVVSCPAERMPNLEILKKSQEIALKNGCSISVEHDPLAASKDADAVYADVWVSMGDTLTKEEAFRIFGKYQINRKIMDVAKKDCIVMHCLPAHRDEEVSAEVLDGPQSVIFDQTENRLHAQKAILYALLK